MEKGTLMKFDFTAKLEDGKVFDTSIKEIGDKNGLKRETYAPMTILLGEDKIQSGLEEALLSLPEGEEKEFTVSPEKAFGPRIAELVKIIPIQQFRSQGMKPYPGMTFNVEGARGKVQSVSGGRVRVDFNSEFAGRTVTYTIKIISTAKTDEEKAGFLFERTFGYEPKVKIESEFVEFSTDSFSPQKKKLAEDIKKMVGKAKSRFVEEIETK